MPTDNYPGYLRMNNEAVSSLDELNNEIVLLMKYGVPEDEAAEAAELLEKYRDDYIALNVLHNFYSFLPEGQEDGITLLRRITNKQGAFLLCASTLISDYLYLSTREGAEFLGPLKEGIWDQDILEYFGWPDRESFLKSLADPAGFHEHQPLNQVPALCPVCGTGDGETHAFGCPVEICPWCGGQLTSCECRFTKTGKEKLSRESHLDKFLELLEEKGRIPFDAKEHRPTFMKETP